MLGSRRTTSNLLALRPGTRHPRQVGLLRAMAVLLALGGLSAAPGTAEIRVKVLDDGTQMVYNSGQAQAGTVARGAPFSTRLLPAPRGLDPLIDRFALDEGLSPRLVQAVMQVESAYDQRALSKKGAMGLMQLMPDTARELGVRDPWNPADNIRGGARYLRQQLDRFGGDLSLALAAYNAGPTAVERHRGIPPYAETQRYVGKVLALYEKNPPEILRAYARDQSRARQEQTSARVASERSGDRVYVTRDAQNRIIFTTAPPG